MGGMKWSVTNVLMGINIALFLIMGICGVSLFAPSTEQIIAWGGNSMELASQGQSWRLLTSMFVHIGLLHLAMNMYALFYIGRYLEPILGKVRFLAAYVTAGLLSGLASLWWYQDHGIVSAGASGAIFGMFGVFLALLTTRLISERVRMALLKSTVAYVGYNIVFGITRSGVDNAAHIGGLLGGVAIGYLLHWTLSTGLKKQLQLATFAFFAVLIVVGDLGLTSGYQESDARRFKHLMQEFVSIETRVNELIDSYNKSNLLVMRVHYDKEILKTWDECKGLAKEAERLKLKGDFSKRRNTFVKWANLSARRYELFSQSLSENTTKYDTEIEHIDKEIESLLQQYS